MNGQPINANDIGLPKLLVNASFVDGLLGLVYMALAAFAILMIVRAGLLYVTHGSDSSAQKQARETIIYAVAALIASTIVFAGLLYIVDALGG